MKLIQAMKQIKDLQRKADDLKKKIALHCADYDFEQSVYADQRSQVESWVQGVSDLLKEILRLRVAIQRTNLATPVTIDLPNGVVTKTIAEWIHRRRDLAKSEEALWACLSDRGLKDGLVKTSSGEPKDVKVRRYYDPKTRDTMVDAFRSEPLIVDATLEIINATTDLIE